MLHPLGIRSSGSPTTRANFREAGFRKRLNWIRRTISHRRPLLAYGLVESKLLFMIAGLLFIPLSPLMLSIGFGLWTKQWRLARQA
jgi:hypothetical protein